MKSYLTEFINEFDYPEDAKAAIMEGYTKAEENTDFSNLLKKLYEEYVSDVIDWDVAAEKIATEADKINLHKYTAHLIFFIVMTKHTRTLYEKNNIPYNIFKDTFCDFKYKLFECYHRHNIWGSSCYTAWYTRFFKLERFALGRLQYEVIPYRGEVPYTKNGVTINPQDPVLNTHIPSSGPLTPESVEESFTLAHSFFSNVFTDDVTPISCQSWLLFPEHYNMLPEKSNIIQFMNRFDIVESGTYDSYIQFITIFGKPYSENLDEFPADNSLRRGYINLAKSGKPSGYGLGITLYTQK